jgi:hypothetical protein
MKKELLDVMAVKTALPAAAYAADNTPAAVDVSNFAAAIVSLAIGIGGITFTTSNKIEFKLTHSHDNSTYEAVTIADVTGISSVGTGGIIHSLVAEQAAAALVNVGYVGGRKYLKLLADFSGTHGTGTPLAAVVVCAEPLIAPV